MKGRIKPMPDPIWTAQYNFSQTPEANGFTRQLYNAPVVTLVTTGATANRRVEINSNNGDAIFLTSSVPSLNKTLGTTMQVQVAVSGVGDAGFEMTFLDLYFLVMIYADRIMITIDNGQPETEISVAANTATTTVRATISADNTLRVYRNTVLIHTVVLPTSQKPFQRVLWWGEGGGTQTFRQMAYFIAGAVQP
jgi:hypothetical protein